VGATTDDEAATWLFYVIVAALMIILGLSIFVVVAWRQVESGHGCVVSWRLAGFTERFLRRKPDAGHHSTQPAPASIHLFIILSFTS